MAPKPNGASNEGGAGTEPSCSLLRSSLELSDTKVYEPYIRALLGTDSHFLAANRDEEDLPPAAFQNPGSAHGVL